MGVMSSDRRSYQECVHGQGEFNTEGIQEKQQHEADELVGRRYKGPTWRSEFNTKESRRSSTPKQTSLLGMDTIEKPWCYEQ